MSNLIPGGAAAESGALEVGDILLQVKMRSFSYSSLEITK